MYTANEAHIVIKVCTAENSNVDGPVNEVQTQRLLILFAAIHDALCIFHNLIWGKTHRFCQRCKLGYLYLALCSKDAVDGLDVHPCFLC